MLTGYLALMACYGAGNLANDLWIEQVFKRGWSTWQIPNVLEPTSSACGSNDMSLRSPLAAPVARAHRDPHIRLKLSSYARLLIQPAACSPETS